MRVAVLGVGNMGRALIRGLLQRYGTDVVVMAWDQSECARKNLPAQVRCMQPSEWFADEQVPRVVVFAVKPNDIDQALQLVLPHTQNAKSLIWCSIAAGVTIGAIERQIGSQWRVCRVMPNTPALIGEGVSAYALNHVCDDDDEQLVTSVLAACGQVVGVQEKLMNAVTGLSGSGPAYVYQFIEGLIEGGVSAGLPYDIARQLAVQTVRGAAGVVEQTGEAPSVLKAAVMSPGGTTARGCLELEAHHMKYAVMRAVIEATQRAEQLGS